MPERALITVARHVRRNQISLTWTDFIFRDYRSKNNIVYLLSFRIIAFSAIRMEILFCIINKKALKIRPRSMPAPPIEETIFNFKNVFIKECIQTVQYKFIKK